MRFEELLSRALRAIAAVEQPHAVVGGLAANLWVAPERARETYDIDFACAAWNPADDAELRRRLEAQGAEVIASTHLPLRRVVIHRVAVENTMIDIVVPRNAKYAATALARRAESTMRETPVPVLAPEDVFLFKAVAKREKDLQPMAALAVLPTFDRAYVERWARTLGVWRFAKRGLKTDPES